MSDNQFGTTRRNVSQHVQYVVLKREYQELPVYLDSISIKNKATQAIALQKEQNINFFFRFFLGFPIAIKLGKLTLDDLVADCFYFNTPSYDGVV